MEEKMTKPEEYVVENRSKEKIDVGTEFVVHSITEDQYRKRFKLVDKKWIDELHKLNPDSPKVVARNLTSLNKEEVNVSQCVNEGDPMPDPNVIGKLYYIDGIGNVAPIERVKELKEKINQLLHARKINLITDEGLSNGIDAYFKELGL